VLGTVRHAPDLRSRTAQVHVVRVTPQAAEARARYPEGVVELVPWLVPAP
jgi:hypothetical protein